MQRVPGNDKTGRRHSSTVTFIVADAVPVGTMHVDPADVDESTFRSSGAGGQHRNKTDSAVRLRHRPTGLTVTAVESRSQWENRQTAWERLQAAIKEQAVLEHRARTDGERASQFGGSRCWVWCAWRDEVCAPDGYRASMRRALRGDLARLLDT